MGRVIAAKNLDRAIGYAFENSLAIARRAQRRIHLEISIVCRPGRQTIAHILSKNTFAVLFPKLFAASDGGIGQGKMVRASFSGNGDASFLGITQQLDAAGSAEMLAMYMGASRLSQQDAARINQFLA